MNVSMNVYRQSRIAPLSGLLLMSLAGAVSAGVLGFAYTWAIVYIPIIYLNILLTIGLGLGVGIAVGMAARAGHVRSSFMTASLAVLWGAVAWYVAWAADPRARLAGPFPWLLWEPEALWAYASACYEHGTWTFGRHAKQPVTGIILGAVWVIEAGAILWFARKVALGYSSSSTYCERCSRWIETQEDIRRLARKPGVEASLSQLLSGDVSAVGSFERAAPDDPTYLRLDLTCCPSCEESDYLTVNLVTHQQDKKGKVTVNVEPLVDRMAIAHADIEAVREAGFEPREEALAAPATGLSPEANQSP
jgi:hypothetical protein